MKYATRVFEDAEDGFDEDAFAEDGAAEDAFVEDGFTDDGAEDLLVEDGITKDAAAEDKVAEDVSVEDAAAEDEAGSSLVLSISDELPAITRVLLSDGVSLLAACPLRLQAVKDPVRIIATQRHAIILFLRFIMNSPPFSVMFFDTQLNETGVSHPELLSLGPDFTQPFGYGVIYPLCVSCIRSRHFKSIEHGGIRAKFFDRVNC